LVIVDPGEQLVEVVSGEGPLEWSGDLAVVVAEAEEPLAESVEGIETELPDGCTRRKFSA